MTDILRICLFERSYTVEHRIELNWDMLINVALSEEPFLIAARFDDVLEESVYLKALENINVQAVLERSRGLVGYDVIDFVVVFRKIMYSLADLVVVRLFALPPHFAVAAELVVLTVSAAECEYALAIDSVYLTAHKVNDVVGYPVDLAAVPFSDRHFLENIEVFVAAVNESYIEILGSELFEICVFLFGIVPDKAEIAAYYKGVSA